MESVCPTEVFYGLPTVTNPPFREMTMGESAPAPQPRRRAGLLGVHSLDSFSLTVPDLATAQGFYREFGLTVTERGNSLGLFTDGSTHCWGTFSEGRTK